MDTAKSEDRSEDGEPKEDSSEKLPSTSQRTDFFRYAAMLAREASVMVKVALAFERIQVTSALKLIGSRVRVCGVILLGACSFPSLFIGSNATIYERLHPCDYVHFLAMCADRMIKYHMNHRARNQVHAPQQRLGL